MSHQSSLRAAAATGASISDSEGALLRREVSWATTTLAGMRWNPSSFSGVLKVSAVKLDSSICGTSTAAAVTLLFPVVDNRFKPGVCHSQAPDWCRAAASFPGRIVVSAHQSRVRLFEHFHVRIERRPASD
jgi:hypothetical protein